MRMAAAILLVLLAGASGATTIPGGGSSRTDCLATFQAAANWPASRPKAIRCADGDPACDGDGAVNGSCGFAVSVCVNSSYNAARCISPGVQFLEIDHAQDNGDPLFDPDFQALESRIGAQIDLPSSTPNDCTSAVTIHVPLDGPFPGSVCRQGKKQIRTTTLGLPLAGRQSRDTDKLDLTCLPPAGACDPTLLFDGTFDRIERQIFARKCATSGCHDSQGQAGGLLLESGTSLSALLDRVPTNGAASALGWRRVDGIGANAESSFLYRKLNDDLPAPGLGQAMPYGQRPLDGFLRDLVALWIEAGAPASGWVAGTDG